MSGRMIVRAKRSRSASSAAAVRSVKQAVRRIAEKKVYDTIAGGTSTTVTNTTPIIDDIADIASGADISSRIGNKITVRSVHIRAHLWSAFGINVASDTSLYNSTDAQPVVWRVALVQDRQPAASGTNPVFTDIFSNNSTVANVLSFQAVGQLERFKVIRTWTFCPPVGSYPLATTPQALPQSVYMDEFVPIRASQSELRFQGATGTTCNQNKLLLVVFNNATAQNVARSLPAHYIRYSVRVRFTDM